MTSKEALRKLYFDNEDLKVDITLNDIKVCEIYNTIKQDLDRLEKLEGIICVLNDICNIKLGNVIENTGMYRIEIMGKMFLVDKERYYAFRKVLDYDK